MNRYLSLTISIILASGAFSLPASAKEPSKQTFTPKSSIHRITAQTSDNSESGFYIPKSAAIIVAFPENIEFDAGQGTGLPLTLMLAEPVRNVQGKELVPAMSMVRANLVPVDGGIKIVADHLLVNGQLVPVKASTEVIPTTTFTVATGVEKARENSSAYSRIGAGIFGVIDNNDSKSMMRGALAGQTIGILSGITAPETVKVIGIPRGSVYMLQLQESVKAF